MILRKKQSTTALRFKKALHLEEKMELGKQNISLQAYFHREQHSVGGAVVQAHYALTEVKRIIYSKGTGVIPF